MMAIIFGFFALVLFYVVLVRGSAPSEPLFDTTEDEKDLGNAKEKIAELSRRN